MPGREAGSGLALPGPAHGADEHLDPSPQAVLRVLAGGAQGRRPQAQSHAASDSGSPFEDHQGEVLSTVSGRFSRLISNLISQLQNSAKVQLVYNGGMRMLFGDRFLLSLEMTVFLSNEPVW